MENKRGLQPGGNLNHIAEVKEQELLCNLEASKFTSKGCLGKDRLL